MPKRLNADKAPEPVIICLIDRADGLAILDLQSPIGELHWKTHRHVEKWLPRPDSAPITIPLTKVEYDAARRAVPDLEVIESE